MSRKARLAVCLPLVLFGAGCAAEQELATQVADQGDRLDALEGQLNEVITSVAGLSATIDQLVEAEDSHTPRFDLALAQFVMDTAGFHGIAESLAAGDPIDPGSLSAASRVHKILSSTEWPEMIDGWMGLEVQEHGDEG